jgi:hypothetical protein
MPFDAACHVRADVTVAHDFAKGHHYRTADGLYHRQGRDYNRRFPFGRHPFAPAANVSLPTTILTIENSTEF